MRPERLDRRQRRLWELHDFSAGRGLEIGPLHNVSIPREHADVSYLDVYDRAGLVRAYADDPNVPSEQIPDIDYVLHDGQRVRSIPEATAGAAPFDWVMASHVIEHVPDAVGWLAQVAEVTVDHGRLVLIVPDRRYCFDVHRPGTTVGQLLQAHELGDTVPSVRAVYDYKRGHASTQAADAWAGRPPGYETRIYSLEQVSEQVAKARAGEYVDAHVWTFTPGTLVEQVRELRALGLCSWAVDAHVPTRRGALEFRTVLRRLPREQPWEPILAEEPVSEASMPDWLEEWVELRAKVRRVQDRARRRSESVEQLEKQLAQARRHNEQLRVRLQEVEGSWRWRAGGMLTRPVRATRSATRWRGRRPR